MFFVCLFLDILTLIYDLPMHQMQHRCKSTHMNITVDGFEHVRIRYNEQEMEMSNTMTDR